MPAPRGSTTVPRHLQSMHICKGHRQVIRVSCGIGAWGCTLCSEIPSKNHRQSLAACFGCVICYLISRYMRPERPWHRRWVLNMTVSPCPQTDITGPLSLLPPDFGCSPPKFTPFHHTIPHHQRINMCEQSRESRRHSAIHTLN